VYVAFLSLSLFFLSLFLFFSLSFYLSLFLSVSLPSPDRVIPLRFLVLRQPNARQSVSFLSPFQVRFVKFKKVIFFLQNKLKRFEMKKVTQKSLRDL
jgi:hypothetical protein